MSPAIVRGPYVRAGTEFTVALDMELSSTSSLSGEPFHATVESPLFDTDHQTAVPSGAALLGHVARVTAGSTPRIVLDFDAIQTPGGASPVVVKVVEVLNATKATGEFERSLLASPLVAKGPEDAIEPQVTPAGHVYLPSGLLMRLELTRPLFLHEARAAPTPS